jgi:hypothetical protein
MKLGYVISSFVVLVVGVGWRLGIGREDAPMHTVQMRAPDEAIVQNKMELNASLIELASVESGSEPIASSSVHASISEPLEPAPSASTPQVEVSTTIAEFDSLSYCDQMDALDRAGKSVSEFVLNSGLFSQYDQAQQSECPWHRSQLDLAYQILYPPLIAAASTTDTSGSGDSVEVNRGNDKTIAYEDGYNNQAEFNAQPPLMPPRYRLSRRQWWRYQQRRANQWRQSTWRTSDGWPPGETAQP